MSRSILLAPSVERGNGSGHLVRCISLARSLGEGASLYLPEERAPGEERHIWSAAELSLSYARELAGLRVLTRLPPSPRRGPREKGAWDLVVIDRRATSLAELAAWDRYAPVAAIDEGGEAREAAHYLIDILPRHPRAGGGAANKSGIGLLDLPRSRRPPPAEFGRVLVAFGGEDGAGLTLGLARLLLAEGLVRPSDLTVVSGALRRGAPPVGLDGATVLGPVQDLKEHLSRFDLVLTQFGLTAFEAAWAGCGVVLLNPSRYHRELSRAAGFPEVGVRKPDLKALRRYLRSPAEVLSRVSGILPHEAESLADCVAGLAPAGPKDCPACGSGSRRALHRGPGKSYFRCGDCGMVYLARFSPGREEPYNESYFFEEYRRQYGKTYLEDWPGLTALAESRLDVLESVAESSLGRSKGLSLLDVGCAYGPFLAAARARGQEPYGVDAAEEAASFVRRELGIPAAAGDFLDQSVASAFGGPFDAVSMWYVVEHFDRLDRALRNAAALTRPGGVLAISTPSLEGATGRFDRAGFFERSPDDHFTLWEPSRARALLKAFGFRVARIRITGHHPERLPGLRRLAAGGGGGWLGRALAALGLRASRILGLGDTFEIYAIREDAVGGAPPGGDRRDSAPDARAERGAIRGPNGT